MNIQPVYNSPNFTSSERIVYNGVLGRIKGLIRTNDNDVIHRNTTYFFRKDMDWDGLCEFLINKYKNTNKVNTYCYACSDGSEPYSLIMELKSNASSQAEKFFPIVAKDYDEQIINYAQSGSIYVPDYDKNIIRARTNGNFDRFFGDDVIIDKRNNSSGRVFNVTPELSKGVTFEVCNMMDDVHNIKPDNSIVFCRNFWPYLKSSEKMDTLAQRLYNQLGENSVVILGRYDEEKILPYQAMIKAGFRFADFDLRIFDKSSISKIYY